jgi:FMN phosphatase YigB (HAD superfamily)
MKFILVDAVHTLIDSNFNVDQEMFKMLESFQNQKIIVTNAGGESLERIEKLGILYPIFTLCRNPEKINSDYFRQFMMQYDCKNSDLLYFDHNILAVKAAEIVGIKSFHYEVEKRNIEEVKNFLTDNL